MTRAGALRRFILTLWVGIVRFAHLAGERDVVLCPKPPLGKEG
jgi:hypothetical protein